MTDPVPLAMSVRTMNPKCDAAEDRVADGAWSLAWAVMMRTGSGIIMVNRTNGR